MVKAPEDLTGASEDRVLAIFRDTLELDVDVDTQLIEGGLLDSLAFVGLLAELERIFGVQVDIGALELDDFQCVSRIAQLVDSLIGVAG